MQHLTLLSAVSMPRGAFSPVFSPDGTLLRYQEDIEPSISNRKKIETCIFDVERHCLFSRFRGQQAVWAPESQFLAFVRDDKIYLAERDGSEVRTVDDGSNPRWHPNGTILYWVKKVDGQTRIMRANVELMTAAEQIVPPFPGSWAISPDGRWLAYIHAKSNPNRITELPELVMQIGCFPDQLEVRVINLDNGHNFVVDHLSVGAGDIALGWSPDAKTLAYAFNQNYWWNSPEPIRRRICLWQPGESCIEVVDASESVSVSRPSWSPDGSRLALLANPWGHFTTDTFGWLTVFDVKKRTVCWQCSDVAANPPIIWSPDGGTLYCRLGSHTEQPYVSFSADGQLLRKVTPEGHYSSSASISPDSTKLAVSARSFSGLNEIWLCSVQDETTSCITSTSKTLDDFTLSDMWTHRWSTIDGLSFDGIVIEPKGESSKDAPILLFTCVDERGWDITHLEPNANWGFLLHWIAQRGYRVFIPSHRLTGLVGLQYLTGQFRPFWAVADIVTGVNSLRERLCTEASVVVFGQSIGGDLACEMLVSYPELLTAAVVSGIVPDFASVYSIEATSNPILRETFGGPPWEHPQEYLSESPIRGVAQVQAPILILMGSQDTSCPTAERFYVALSEAGKDVTYLQFQEQGHWPEEPERVTTYVEIAMQWLDEKITSREQGEAVKSATL